jgi:tight adherence protein C
MILAFAALNTFVLWGFIVIVAVCTGLYLTMPNPERAVKARLAGMKAPNESEENEAFARGKTEINRIGKWVGGSALVGAGELAKMQQALGAAGFYNKSAVQTLVFTKVGLAIILVTVLWLGLIFTKTMPESLLWSALFMILALWVGWRLPDMYVDNVSKSRRYMIKTGMADALDLLVICVEAGLGLEQSLDRVSRDIELANPVVAGELSMTVAEMKVLPRQRDALDNFAQRANLPSVKSVVTTLVQSIQYGTPLAQSLRVLSAEMRAHRMLEIEEKAARLPVLLTLPLILFILPSLFLLIASPAALKVYDLMHGQ